VLPVAPSKPTNLYAPSSNHSSPTNYPDNISPRSQMRQLQQDFDLYNNPEPKPAKILPKPMIREKPRQTSPETDSLFLNANNESQLSNQPKTTNNNNYTYGRTSPSSSITSAQHIPNSLYVNHADYSSQLYSNKPAQTSNNIPHLTQPFSDFDDYSNNKNHNTNIR